jgi:phage portal protein BeeE
VGGAVAVVRVLPDRHDYVRGYHVAPPGLPPVEFGPDEIVHLKYPNPLDPLYGLSPLQANALTVDANTELQRAVTRRFGRGSDRVSSSRRSRR